MQKIARLSAAKWCLIFLAAGLAWAAMATPQQKPDGNAPPQTADIEVFVREGCPHCAKAEAFLAELKHEQPQLKIAVRDVRKEPAALAQLRLLASSKGLDTLNVPTFAVGGQLIVGFSAEAGTAQLIRDSLAQAQAYRRKEVAPSAICTAEASQACEENATLAKPETFAVNFFGLEVSLDQVGLPLFTLAMGLLDGFNPCSMWVLLLMISLLAPMKDRRRMFAIAGTFIAVQGAAYFVFLAAWLNLFLLIGLSRASEIVIAALALLAGAVNLKDFFASGRGISLSIPAATKPGIYARMRNILQAENLAGAIAGVVLLAVLVQIVELMCTSGFPALFTRILTLEQLDAPSYFGYLLLYDLAYMLDDMSVLVVGVVTLSQRRLQENEGRWLKLISGSVMVGLGMYLLVSR